MPPARMGLDVDAILVGRGRDDSMIAMAAWDIESGEAEEAPRTMTWRLVDFKADRRCEGGAGRRELNQRQ